MLTKLVKTIANTNNNTRAKYCWYQYQYCFWFFEKYCHYQYHHFCDNTFYCLLHTAMFIFSTVIY